MKSVHQTLGNTRVSRHFSEGPDCKHFKLVAKGLSQLTGLCHCSTNTCHQQFLNEDVSPSDLIYGDWDFVFHLISLCNRILFFLFFKKKFSPPANAKALLAHTSYKSRLWAGLGPWGGVGWLLGYSIRKRGWWGEVVSHFVWQEMYLEMEQWRHPALVKGKESQEAASQPLPSSFFAPSTPKATSGYGIRLP